MAGENEIDKRGKEFLHALRPKPESPASRQKPKDELPEEQSIPASPVSKGAMAEEDYLRLFIRERGNLVFRLSPRQVLVNRNMHNTITNIVNIIGHGELSVAQYVNNVLALHLRENSELITRLLKENFNPKI